ncbi:MAG TPA: DUF3667 domain-containing protein [Longimicrobiaceae bacterium]|nr:DUF3667 domain-containing protein [Longimicrobiaceae bacterium]
MPHTAVRAAEPPRTAANPDACAACGAAPGTRFCGECGEPRVRERDYSLRRFLRESFASVTDLDSALFRSLAALIGRPGELTADYFSGGRRRYLAPLKVFFLCNVVFFFVQSVTHTGVLSSPLHVYTHYDPFQRVATGIVQGRLAARGITQSEYARVFDPESVSQAKTLVIVMAPMLALLLALLYLRSRRFFLEHLVFSVHFYAFFLLAIPAFMGLAALLVTGWMALGGPRPQWIESDGAAGLLMFCICAVYLRFAIQRYYGGHPLAVVGRTLLLAPGLLAALQAYRFILFFTVLART